MLPALKDLRAVIFDRDGTLNASGSAANGGYILRDTPLVLLPGVATALMELHARKISMFVFSQQNCVSKGLIDEAGVDAVHAKLNTLLSPVQITGFYFNTQARAGDDWSKPGPGMLNAILREHGGLSPANCLVVGDAVRDAESAAAAGLPFAFVASDQHDKTEEARKTGLPLFADMPALIKALK